VGLCDALWPAFAVVVFEEEELIVDEDGEHLGFRLVVVHWGSLK